LGVPGSGERFPQMARFEQRGGHQGAPPISVEFGLPL
jgi:hypothetical protein